MLNGYNLLERPVLACLVLALSIAMIFYSPASFLRPDSTSENDKCYQFISQWYDPIGGIVKKLKLSLFLKDQSIEMYDLAAGKIFLKRHHIPEIDEKDFYVGNSVLILSRQLKITDYADEATRQEVSTRRQRTFAMVKPDAVHHIGEIIDLMQDRGFEVIQMKMVHLSVAETQAFYAEHSERPFFEGLVNYISSGPVIAMELIGNDAVVEWRRTLGPTDSNTARTDAPESLRAKFGTDKTENAAHGSDSLASATRELEFFFSLKKGNTIKAVANLFNSTCCVIKPHAVKAGNLGKILTFITKEGFRLTALQMFRLEKRQAEEFLEVYNEILPEYPRMVQQLISGPLVALEISGTDDGSGIDGTAVQQRFREIVGPVDPEVAKDLRPNSLRAKFGEEKVRNAVHCSDLPEEAAIEVEYFFKILQ